MLPKRIPKALWSVLCHFLLDICYSKKAGECAFLYISSLLSKRQLRGMAHSWCWKIYHLTLSNWPARDWLDCELGAMAQEIVRWVEQGTGRTLSLLRRMSTSGVDHILRAFPLTGSSGWVLCRCECGVTMWPKTGIEHSRIPGSGFERSNIACALIQIA